MIEKLNELERIAQHFDEIPANEQYIGHMQVAIKRSLELIHSLLDDLCMEFKNLDNTVQELKKK